MPLPSHKSTSPFKPVWRQPPLEVLILDDERFDRHRLARLCSGLTFPCNISNAKTLAEFREHLDQTRFGLVLLDYALPDGTGLDALQIMHMRRDNLNTPALMVSGRAQEDLAQQAQAAGCCGFLAKEALSSDEFARAVQDALMLTAPLMPADPNSFDPAEVEQLLARSVALCAQDIKPMVSRLMRQMRELRAQKVAEVSTGAHAAEQNCLSLWSFLVEMERQDGAALLANITTPSAAERRAAMGTKPPSPFGTPRQ